MEKGSHKVLHEMIMVVGNKTLVCETNSAIPRSFWIFRNPLLEPAPLLFFQLGTIYLFSQFVDLCLKRLGQSSIVSQILGGIIFGPSVLGQSKEFSRSMFPARGTVVLETMATFGIMFFFFSVSVKMDPAMMVRSGRKAMTIGVSVFFLSMALSISLSIILMKYLPMDTSLKSSLLFITASQSFTGFPVIACLLTELKMVNTDIGRLALSSAMVCDIIGICLTGIGFSIVGSKGVLASLVALSSAIAFLGAIVFICRPVILWMARRTPEGKPMTEGFIFTIFVFVLATGFLGELIGQHYILGPLVLGLVVPDGPPIGAALSSKLDILASGLFYPAFLTISGLQTNVFTIHFRSLWIVGIIVVFSCMIKIGAAMLPALHIKMPLREAFVLGLILNARGIIELTVYNLCKESKILLDQEFSLGVMSVVVVTAIIAPLIKVLYNPSRKYISVKRNTIQHSKRDQELRILVCIHNHDSVPTVINLLEVSHATEESPVAVTAMFLVELIGRTTPILVEHQAQRTLDSNASTSSHTVNALRQYEIHNEGYATVQSFTSISPWVTMHDDICRLAFDKRATIVFLPFHKQWAIDGTIGSTNRAIQNMNLNVLEKAPCSVGILIDRGVLSRSLSVLTQLSLFHVAVLYIGGPDDAESLAYGARMARHEYVDLTVVRFLLFGGENSKDRKRESDLIDEYRQAQMGNERFVYIEEVVRDGEGLSQAIRAMVDCFDLMLVGRYHQESPLTVGLDEWSECSELGVIGDMLASPEFGNTSSVLVVQQHRIGGKLVSNNTQQVVNDREPLIHNVPKSGAGGPLRNHDGSFSVSMER